MSFKAFLIVNLIILAFSLKGDEPLFRAMTELKPPLIKEACEFEFKKDKEKFIYMKPCEEGYNCGNKMKDISICIPNYLGQKLGEACNYDAECLFGHCENQKCTFSEKDKPKHYEIEDFYRCGNGLFYLESENKCAKKDEFDYLENYCRYTKKGGKEVRIHPISPFYVCGESGIVPEGDKNLEPGTVYTKINKMANLDTGKKTVSEYACKTGGVTKCDDDEFWICDNIIKMTSGVKDGKAYADYEFQIAGKKTITEDDYDGLFFYRNEMTGDLIPFNKDYFQAVKKYYEAIKKYENKCKKNTHDYYLRPFDCGIREIYNAYFYLNNMYLFNNNTDEAVMIRDALRSQDFDNKYVSSNILTFKKSILMVFAILVLL
jgi:hypothetical protein